MRESGNQCDRRRPAPPVSFAGELARMSGLSHVRFAVPTSDARVIDRAKRIFGTGALSRLLIRLVRELVRLCRKPGRR